MAISWADSALIATIVESVLYGIAFSLFFVCLWSLLYNRTRPSVNKAMLATAFILIGMTTAHMVISAIHTRQGFISIGPTYTGPPGTPGGPTGFFRSANNGIFVDNIVLYFIQTLIWDAVLVWRCYVVWQAPLAIVAPALAWIAAFVSGCGVLKLQLAQGSIFGSALPKWIIAFYSTTFAGNLISNLLIAYRIWSIDRRVSKMRQGKSHIRTIMIIGIDSGVLYSLCIVTTLGLYVSESNAHLICLDMNMSVICIAFYMVTIRTKLASDPAFRSSREDQSISGRSINIPADRSAAHRGAYRMEPMEVHIKRMVESEDAGGSMDVENHEILK